MSASDDGETVIRVLELPSWLRSPRALVETLSEMSRFRQVVLSFVATWIVGGILSIGETIIEAILLVFEPILRVIGVTERSIVQSFRPVGEAIFGFWASLIDTVASVAGISGPLAPVVTIGLVAIGLGLLLRLTISIAGEVPVLSTVVDYLGLR